MGQNWLEVRCTQEGFLPTLDDNPAPGASAFQGVLSVVLERADRRVRRLPAIYLGPSPVFTARRPEALKQHLQRALEILRRAPQEPTYALTPVRLDDHVGLYARDMAVRDTFRMYLRRCGLAFAEEPFVRLSERNSFMSSWGEIAPRFIILGHYDHDEPEKVLETTGAFVPFMLAKYRLGAISPPELRRLIDLSRDVVSMSSASAIELVDGLRHELAS